MAVRVIAAVVPVLVPAKIGGISNISLYSIILLTSHYKPMG